MFLFRKTSKCFYQCDCEIKLLVVNFTSFDDSLQKKETYVP